MTDRTLTALPVYNEVNHVDGVVAGALCYSREVLVVDDGSTDATAELARRAGATLVRLPLHRGLAAAFTTGLQAALDRGADVIVNADADGQYDPGAIPALVAPIVAGEADMVLGDRGVATLAHFSPLKRWLQRLGSRVVRLLSGVPVFDATTGFRAFSRAAAARLNCFTTYTYTLETLIQAGARKMAVAFVPIRTNPQTRRSRLIRNLPSFISLSTVTIIRFYVMYQPLRVFLTVGGILLLLALIPGLRFLFLFWSSGGTAGHIQSLILAAILAIVGFQVCLIGLVADLVRMNRKMLEETLYRVRRAELDSGIVLSRIDPTETDHG
jgi:glycosyltransferase involved in cell wall biosynthesis